MLLYLKCLLMGNRNLICFIDRWNWLIQVIFLNTSFMPDLIVCWFNRNISVLNLYFEIYYFNQFRFFFFFKRIWMDICLYYPRVFVAWKFIPCYDHFFNTLGEPLQTCFLFAFYGIFTKVQNSQWDLFNPISLTYRFVGWLWEVNFTQQNS